jgi:hypothetical protein
MRICLSFLTSLNEYSIITPSNFAQQKQNQEKMAKQQSTKKTDLPASKKQKIQLIALFMRIIYDLIEALLYGQAQLILSQKDAEKVLRKKVNTLFEVDIADEWAEEKAWLENFWKTVFNYTINWNDFTLPAKTAEFPHLNIMPTGFTAEQIYSGIMNCKNFAFKKRSKYYSDIDEAIKNAKAVQVHATGNYAWADRGTAEPDACHLGKSYDDAIEAKILFLGPIEYLLSCAEFELRTGKVYDVKGLTRLSVLDADGNAMYGSWSGGFGSRLSNGIRDDRSADHGPREAVFAS